MISLTDSLYVAINLSLKLWLQHHHSYMSVLSMQVICLTASVHITSHTFAYSLSTAGGVAAAPSVCKQLSKSQPLPCPPHEACRSLICLRACTFEFILSAAVAVAAAPSDCKPLLKTSAEHAVLLERADHLPNWIVFAQYVYTVCIQCLHVLTQP